MEDWVGLDSSVFICIDAFLANFSFWTFLCDSI